MDTQTDLDRLCKSHNLTANFRYGEARKPGWPGSEASPAHNWRVILKYQGRQLSTDFFGGAGVNNPSPAHVIGSLCLDAKFGEMSFEEFCSEFGYDLYDANTCKTAHNTWEACVGVIGKVHQLLGDDFDLFAQAEH